MADYETTSVETYRRLAVQKTREVEELRETVASLQKQIYDGYKRIKELTDEKSTNNIRISDGN